jgi:hypothetical protein
MSYTDHMWAKRELFHINGFGSKSFFFGIVLKVSKF